MGHGATPHDGFPACSADSFQPQIFGTPGNKPEKICVGQTVVVKFGTSSVANFHSEYAWYRGRVDSVPLGEFPRIRFFDSFTAKPKKVSVGKIYLDCSVLNEVSCTDEGQDEQQPAAAAAVSGGMSPPPVSRSTPVAMADVVTAATAAAVGSATRHGKRRAAQQQPCCSPSPPPPEDDEEDEDGAGPGDACKAATAVAAHRGGVYDGRAAAAAARRAEQEEADRCVTLVAKRLRVRAPEEEEKN